MGRDTDILEKSQGCVRLCPPCYRIQAHLAPAWLGESRPCNKRLPYAQGHVSSLAIVVLHSPVVLGAALHRLTRWTCRYACLQVCAEGIGTRGRCRQYGRCCYVRADARGVGQPNRRDHSARRKLCHHSGATGRSEQVSKRRHGGALLWFIVLIYSTKHAKTELDPPFFKRLYWPRRA